MPARTRAERMLDAIEYAQTGEVRPDGTRLFERVAPSDVQTYSNVPTRQEPTPERLKEMRARLERLPELDYAPRVVHPPCLATCEVRGKTLRCNLWRDHEQDGELEHEAFTGDVRWPLAVW